MTKAKIFLVGFLAVGIFLTSGCDSVNYETKFESKSSVEVSTSSYKETKSESDGDLAFKINDVNLSKGKTELYLSITNNSAQDTTLTNMNVSFKASDENKKLIREGKATFENLSINLPAGTEVYENFVLEDANAESYDGDFSVDYEFSNITTNPPVK